jgi:hypothetical protein
MYPYIKEEGVKMKNSDFRKVGRLVLADRGFDVCVKSGQGYLPGARAIAVRNGKKIDVAVKASQERVLGFTKQSSKRWRTLSAVDLVVAVVPGELSKDEADVFGFERKPLERVFNRAWKALEDAERPIGFNMPVFVPIDHVSRKNVGHDIGNLMDLATWSVHLTSKQLEERSGADDEGYVDQFRRRFAAENGVDVAQVMISIVGKLK